MQQDAKQPNYIDLAADIVSAFVSKNFIPVAELPALIQNVHAALNKTAQGITEPAKEDLHPAVSIKKSVTPDYLICLEDGKRFKSLKRHLRTKYELDSGSIPRALESPERLSDGRSQLCSGAVTVGEEHGSGAEARCLAEAGAEGCMKSHPAWAGL